MTQSEADRATLIEGEMANYRGYLNADGANNSGTHWLFPAGAPDAFWAVLKPTMEEYRQMAARHVAERASQAADVAQLRTHD